MSETPVVELGGRSAQWFQNGGGKAPVPPVEPPELARIRSEMQRLAALLATSESARREAQQEAHAERAQRLELQEELARRAGGGGPPALDDARARLRELEHEVEWLRRHEAEGVHAARARVATLERELRAQAARSREACEALEQMRGLIGALRVAGLEAQPVSAVQPARAVEPQRLDAALTRLRDATPRQPPNAEAVAAETGAGRWLPRVFRALASRDPTTAGRLLIALLPAQGLVHPHALGYDLIVSESRCARVTVRDGAARVEVTMEARPLAAVDFRVRGGPAALARLLTAGRVRRLLGRGLARIEGDRGAFEALAALPRAGLSLQQLHATGARLDPLLALTVVALMVEPALTTEDTFTIVHQGARITYFGVDEGRAKVGDGAPPGPVATTIACADEALILVLAGEPGAEELITGERHPLELIRSWIARAQSA